MDDPRKTWGAELLEFFRHWPYSTEDGGPLFVNPPFSPSPEGVDFPGGWERP